MEYTSLKIARRSPGPATPESTLQSSRYPRSRGSKSSLEYESAMLRGAGSPCRLRRRRTDVTRPSYNGRAAFVSAYVSYDTEKAQGVAFESGFGGHGPPKRDGFGEAESTRVAEESAGRSRPGALQGSQRPFFSSPGTRPEAAASRPAF